ncbi:hypothetical protein [Psychroserpens luteolus]|uniref:hypothetical protein n=1 Tax=Psychroserpens luteolus TaxID=2855840 RepID=UPI001E65B7B2|nr:hypothetical protein [Psychroserpens luteolus]MCD2258744.1 hypothetical protein [Psychroserpens luteolus]
MFNQRKNRRFSYKSRLKGSDTEGYREESKEDLKAKWEDMRGHTRRKGSILTSLPALILILVALFVLIYILNRYIK